MENSCEAYLPESPDDSHGTACASLLGAQQDNGVCAVGMAPGATLSACNIFGEMMTTAQAFNDTNGVIDISSNSWGDDSCSDLFYRRRHLQEGMSGCMFDPDAPGSPCGICEEDMMSEDCEFAILDYCSISANFEDHRIECAEYLDLYVDCQYVTLDPALGQSFGQLIEQGRGGLGTIICKKLQLSYALVLSIQQWKF